MLRTVLGESLLLQLMWCLLGGMLGWWVPGPGRMFFLRMPVVLSVVVGVGAVGGGVGVLVS